MVLSEWPVRVCCGQRHGGPVCPDGKVMCCLCFDRFDIDELYEDSDGRWDVCQSCGQRRRVVDRSLKWHGCHLG